MSFSIQHKVLLVDEYEPVSQMLGMLLRTKGYHVITAASGQEGLMRISPDIDLILLDTVLHDVDGYSFCKQIKANPTLKHIPIIIISSSLEKEQRLQMLHLGVDDYLTKPFDAEDLFIRIEIVLRRHNKISTAIDQQRHVQVLKEVQSIIEQERITPFFQPIYYLNPMKVLGFEMLSRPQSQMYSNNPEILFKEALKLGLYLQVEMMAWKKAVDIFSHTAAVDDFQIFLNCNPYLVENNQFAPTRDLFADNGMEPQRVYLELTERSAIGEYSIFNEHLDEYRNGGFRIAVDDVGGGYASLETIVQTKPQVIKIDRHIITGVSADAIKQSIVKLLIAFCRENGIICIAEGIETKQDLDAVIQLGVHAGQGYFLGRPKENLTECLV